MLISEGKNFSLISENNSRVPKSLREFPFEEATLKVLGKKAIVSIALVKANKIRELNRKYRHKDKPTDILSFSNQDGGEILISISEATKKADEFRVKSEDYLPYILIHGLLHLKGHVHSSKMDSAEIKLCKIFSLHYPFITNELKNNSRNRRRHLRNTGSGRKT